MKPTLYIAAVTLALSITACSTSGPREMAAENGASAAHRVDASWPQPLPNKWILGQVAGVAVDGRDHVWIIHRSATILEEEKGATQKPPSAKCCVPAPPVIEFDQSGNVVQAWGGAGQAQGYDWPKNEHGIHVDAEGNVWIGANDESDHHILKFTRDGKFLMQIGRPGKSEGSNSRTQLGRPAHMDVDMAADEVYVADGYGNRRIAVFDSRTGVYKRHWGAYGNAPTDEKQAPYDPAAAVSKQFRNPVHCVRLSRDGLVYACDRQNDRLQVFRKDGTFVTEFFVERQTRATGTVYEIALSPDREQQYLYVADGANGEVHTLRRADGKQLASFGRLGRMAGEFKSLHNIAIDSKGNLYTAEAGAGRRVQRFAHIAQ